MNLSAATVGFVGLGNMGFPMAVNLCKGGHALIVHDVRAEVAERFSDDHACRAARNRRELAENSDILITMLPDGKVVRDVLLSERDGDDAPVGYLRPGSIVVDMSSSGPTGTRELGEKLQTYGVALVDAPVWGGVVRAKSGTLAIMAGGDNAILEKIRPLFDAMAKSVSFVGPLGAGHAMKALNNYVSAAGLLAACEAVATARTFGIAADAALDVLNASSGKNNSTENKIAQFVLPETYCSGFSLGLMHKDLRTALELSKDLNMKLPMAESVVKAWAEAEETLGTNADHTEIARIIH